MTRLLLALIAVLLLITVVAEMQAPESTWGSVAGHPIGNVALEPNRVGMTGDCGMRLALGRVTAAEHELQDGSFNLSALGPDRVTVIFPRGAISLLRVRDVNGKDAELLLRLVEPRTVERLR